MRGGPGDARNPGREVPNLPKWFRDEQRNPPNPPNWFRI